MTKERFHAAVGVTIANTRPTAAAAYVGRWAMYTTLPRTEHCQWVVSALALEDYGAMGVGTAGTAGTAGTVGSVQFALGVIDIHYREDHMGVRAGIS